MDGIKTTTAPGLVSVYDNIKANTATGSKPQFAMNYADTGAQIHKHADALRDHCHKHIIVDVYCKILPLDKEFIDGHRGMMRSDVDAMLHNKGMTATQYMTACSESTNAPLFDFIINSVNGICSQYMEDAKATVDEGKEKGMDVPVPEPPEDPTEDDDVNSQLVDIEADTEYETFVDALKKKTIDKIVDDVTKIINDKDEDDDMRFDPKPVSDLQAELESTTSVCMNYMQNKLIKEGIDTSSITEDMLGYAIREATLNQLDLAANLRGSAFNEFGSRIRFGKGVLVNESAVNKLASGAKSQSNNEGDVNKVIDNANKKRDEEINSRLKASDIVNSAEKGGSDSPLK